MSPGTGAAATIGLGSLMVMMIIIRVITHRSPAARPRGLTRDSESESPGAAPASSSVISDHDDVMIMIIVELLAT